MTDEQILLLISMICVLAAAGFSVAGFLAHHGTAAHLKRRRNTAFVAALLLFVAAGTSWFAGDDGGQSTGVIWFIFAMAQVTNTNITGNQIKKAELEEQRQRQAALDREAEQLDGLAQQFDLPPIPRVQPERNQP